MLAIRVIRSAIVTNLSEHLKFPVIEMHSGVDRPVGSFFTYDFVGGFRASKGQPSIYFESNKRIERETVSFTVSFLSHASDRATSIENGLVARDWFKTAGHVLLKELVDVVVVNVGDLENRDVTNNNVLELRQGFEVEFRTTSVVETLNEVIEKINIQGGN
ncbi:hypothetical protein I6N90_02650 [Paenibacillus sp. GSMTC-2017]|uniref:phage neck terminator protein n=1 Tax=Paenibacillus sp. GSMTC-2017 TaxID=2794350 RepID=UPI0018D5B34D|nr:hypothetical protein [Paenibacillus sp. GSMTC-2017]MBH5316708.1 hypothetical protein [Paenibacillus sp. GSMTC-2017]